jgi:hypothetical protein
MAWFEFHQSLVTHRKLYGLADRLHIGRAQAAGHLAFLWAWALDNAPDGDLSDVPASTIKHAADWPKKAEAFVAALEDEGWLEDGHLHDWDDYAGKLGAARAKNRARMSCARRGHKPCTCGTRARNVQGYSTEEKSTEHNSTQEIPPNPPDGGNPVPLAEARAERARNGSHRQRDVNALRETQTTEEHYLGRHAGKGLVK